MALVGLVLPSRDHASPAPLVADAAAFVRPLAGTQSGGTFPGATTPFGMVQYSPNTDDASGGGYRYSHPVTWGFGVNHLSGPGCPAMGDVVSLPTTGSVRTVDVTRQKTRFSHASEQASPGYYSVNLAPSGVHAELSATTRTGWARFTYPATGRANVIVDPGAGFRGARTSSVRIVGRDTIEGSVSSYGFWHACPHPGSNRYTLHFSMKFNRPFRAFGAGNGSRLRRGGRSARGADAGAYVVFDAASDRSPVVSKVGISYVDASGARRNLQSEAGGNFDFDDVHARARADWDDVLGRVDVEGGPIDRIETFYTALYHSLLHPSVFSDADGRYMGFDARIHSVPRGQAHYTAFSLWDTHRSEHALIDLVAPERVADMMRSLLDDQHQGGWLPKWPYGNFYTNEMIGDPAANVLADALVKGLMRQQDQAGAYQAAIHNATDAPLHSPFEGRVGLANYINRGYMPYRSGGDNIFPASINLEYAQNDCAIALMAARLGRGADANYMLRRAKRYRLTIDPRARAARPRRPDGSWFSPFFETRWTGFKEGSALQYTWSVPQDVGGLAAALGGTSAAIGKLDGFFAYPSVAANTARAGSLWRGNGRFNPRNEADVQAPYLYNYLGQPWKTQDLVRAAESMFTTAPSGLPSSDDLGALSSWYVMSALGIYPFMPGDDHYALTSPLFDRVTIDLRPPYSGGQLVISAPGASSGLVHVQAAALNGQALGSSQVSHGALVGGGGGRLDFALGRSVNFGWGTGSSGTPPSPCSPNPATADVRLGLRELRASRRGAVVETKVRNAGDAAAAGVTLNMRVPRGWSVPHRLWHVGALKPGQTVTRTWLVTTRLRGRLYPLRADAWWAGGSALRTFATANVRAR
jgi:predicted alpha-1,2-mannosidase